MFNLPSRLSSESRNGLSCLIYYYFLFISLKLVPIKYLNKRYAFLPTPHKSW